MPRCALLPAVLMLSGCFASKQLVTDVISESARQHAQFSIECDDLSVTPLGAQAVGITGCGHKLVYVGDSACVSGPGIWKSYVENNCTAILNSTDGEVAE